MSLLRASCQTAAVVLLFASCRGERRRDRVDVRDDGGSQLQVDGSFETADDGAAPAADAVTAADASGSGGVPPSPETPGCHVVTYTPPGVAPQQGDLCIPSTRSEHATAIVLVHGGGSIQGRRADLKAWQDHFVDQGVVALNIDYELISETTPTPIFPLQERNVKAAVQYLRGNATRLTVAPDHIVLLGTSAGSRLGGIALTTPDDGLFAGAGHYAGISDKLDGFIGLYGAFTGALLSETTGLTPREYYGDPATDPNATTRQEAGNAIKNAARASGPVLLIHGVDDAKAPVMQSRRFDTALREAGKDSTLVEVPGADHSFDRQKVAGRPFTEAGRAAADRAMLWIAEKLP